MNSEKEWREFQNYRFRVRLFTEATAVERRVEKKEEDHLSGICIYILLHIRTHARAHRHTFVLLEETFTIELMWMLIS